MAYDEDLAERIRDAVGAHASIAERKMFGGLAFLLDERTFCGIVKDELMVRVGPERYEEALGRPHVRPMDFTGRPMKGYVFVTPNGCDTEEAVAEWVDIGLDSVARLDPPSRRSKPAPRSSRRRPRSE